jgi:RNA polymerase sigma-70 factor (ECF subfamily)
MSRIHAIENLQPFSPNPVSPVVSTDLFERFARGDLDAFETVFRQSHREVYGWIVRIVRDASIAEDLTMETFDRIYRARSRFDPSRPFGGWARRIATHVAIDHLKSLRREVELPAAVTTSPRNDPAWEREVRDAVTAAFRSLPAPLQATATLALVEGHSYEEIAETLDTSVSAVKSRVFRAVRILRKKLERLGIKP